MKWTVFGEDWGSHPSSTQHVFRYLSAREQVVWMNSIGLRQPRLSAHDLKRLYQKGGALLSNRETNKKSTRESNREHKGTKPAEQQPHLQSVPCKAPESEPRTILSPSALPFHSLSAVRRLNRYMLSKQIKNAHKDIASGPHALWLSLPSAVDLIGHCDEDISVYYCGDDFRALAGVDHKTVAKMEDELVEKCDLILTASETLAKRFPTNKTQLLKHGVDFQLFSQPKGRPAQFPENRTIGFYGQLADWVDIELLERIADHYSQWTIMLIGAVHTNTRSLLEKPNVRLLPAMPHADLAAYVQNWDVALLPFRHCQQIYHCNPLKLREYLASGTPIVCTEFQAAHPYQSELTLVSKDEDFVKKLDTTIQRQDQRSKQEEQERRMRQLSLVKNEDWSRKAELAHHYVLSKLNEKRAPSRPKISKYSEDKSIELL